jgi:hypothetical protein
MMDAAEYVLSEGNQLALADLALPSLVYNAYDGCCNCTQLAVMMLMCLHAAVFCAACRMTDAAEYVLSDEDRLALAHLGLVLFYTTSVTAAVSQYTTAHAYRQRQHCSCGCNLLFFYALLVSACRMMDAAEYVLSEEDRLALADLALDQLSDAVTDDGILHMIASLDAAADVQLMLSSGQELLGWLLEKPEVSGAALGELIDEVVNMRRLERAVARNDEVGFDESRCFLHRYNMVAVWLVWWVKAGMWWGRTGQQSCWAGC